MTRFIFGLVATLIFLSSPVYAGFEWVPPAQVSEPADDNNTISDIDMGMAFPSAPVSMEPLAEMPMNIVPAPMPREAMAVAPKVKKLSGQKLVINPYPLREEEVVLGPAGQNIMEVYKSMNEEVGKLNPIKLGNGMTTGAKPKMKAVPRASRLASTSHKTFLTPTGTGITPMMGAEPPPLPGIVSPAKVDRVKLNKVYAQAVGFGRDLPLALALSQVIPSEFTHSFAKDVDAGVIISWEGGKPWDQVLNDMLHTKNLMAVIQGNQVIIQPTARL